VCKTRPRAILRKLGAYSAGVRANQIKRPATDPERTSTLRGAAEVWMLEEQRSADSVLCAPSEGMMAE
jgi:hypothetical protein